MHTVNFIQDLAVIMLIAGVITVLFHRLKQPVVLGYILAGVIIGPHTPPFPLITEQATINMLAELGMIFLMFSLGLEFSLRRLRQVGMTALAAALAEIVLMIWIGYEIGRFFGWQSMDALFLGAMLAISSTTIIVKALEDLKLKHQRFAHLILGILIVEDILAIAIIALLSSLALSGSMDIGQMAGTLTRLSVFMVASVVIGLLLVPRLLAYVARFDSDEMLLVTVLGLCFGFCLLVIRLDYSVALGAFMIGAIIAEARELKRIERLIEPVRDMFSAIFFVAVGLLLDPKVLIDYALPVAVITLAVVIGKVATCTMGAFVAGNDGRTSLRVGMGLAQIGEFSFIIAALGISLQVTSDFLYPIAVAVSAITTLLTPYLIRASDPLADLLARRVPYTLRNSLPLYTEWLQSIQPRGDRAVLAAMVWRIVAHVAVNVMIIAAAFFGMAYFADPLSSWLGTSELGERYQRTVLWAVALILSLPFLVAAYRKLKALSMLLAETGVRESLAGKHTAKVREILSELIPLLSMMLFLLLIGALSSSILPPLELLVLTGSAVTLLGIVLGRKLIRFHSRLQIALMETLQANGSDGKRD
ncbi:MAG: cation:proton antiporter [Gammaproteobacteria bacterium]|nr:cation:proton antiporter [Gammaproteobacteria bacterium]